ALSNQQYYPPNRQQASYPTQPLASTQIPKPPKPAQDLLSDPFDVTLPSKLQTGPPPPAPPVPRNPEKDALLSALSGTLRSQLQQTLQQNATAVSSLRAQHHALQDAHSRLSAEMAQLQQLDALLASNEQILPASMQDADRVIADARHRSLPPIDDVLVAPTVVGGQLWTLVAEERGIGEALWCLGRAMSEGRVSGDVFVKLTRSLAREQFLKKALIRKISRGMGLDEGVASCDKICLCALAYVSASTTSSKDSPYSAPKYSRSKSPFHLRASHNGEDLDFEILQSPDPRFELALPPQDLFRPSQRP
ncbi:hypothetical protein B0A49_07476, partial [Cryomyces minteri]